MVGHNYRLIFQILALRLAFGTLLITLCIRDYLFGNGLYVYRDWTWPLSTNLYPIANFSPGIIRNVGPDPLGFVRMFFTWPIVIIESLTGNPILAEKIYVLYFFSVFIFLFFVLGELILRVVSRERRIDLRLWKKEIFVLSTVLFCVTNFWSLQQISGLYFTYVIEFALIGISVALIFLGGDWLRTTLLPGAILSLCIFLDPNLYLFGLIALVVAILFTTTQRPALLMGSVRALGRVGVVFLTTLPSLLTMLYVLSISTGTNLRPSDYYQSSTGNLSLINSLRLLGYLWSLIAYAPPSVVLYGNSVSNLASAGAPSFMLLPAGSFTSLWLLSTWFVPIFAFGSNLARRFRRLTVPVSVIAIFGILLTQPSIFPFPYILATQLRDTPIIGGALVTALAIPDHALILVAVSYTILVSIGIFVLLTTEAIGRNFKPLSAFLSKRSSIQLGLNSQRALGLGLVIILMIFQGWQFFSGSLYPSGYVWGATGNGISGVGAFAPFNPTPEMFRVHNWLLAQKGDYNIYWPGPSGASYPWSERATGSIASQESPKPTVFPRALPYLLESNLTRDAKDYLSALNIRYLVVQPFSNVAMKFAWGVEDVTSLNQVLARIPGTTPVYFDGDIAVYQVDGSWGRLYSTSVTASHNSSDPAYAIAYSVFATLGIRIALIDSTTNSEELCFNKPNCRLNILSPTYFGFLSPRTKAMMALNDTSVTWPASSLQSSSSTTLPTPWASWLVTNWGSGNSMIGISNGVMELTYEGTPAYLTVSYNGSVTNNNPGGIFIPQGWIAATRIGFWYRTSNEFHGSLQIVVPQLNRSSLVTHETVSPPLFASTDWKYASFNATLPSDTTYFTARFGAQGTDGSVQLRNIELNYTTFQEDSRSPFGNVAPLLGGDLQLVGLQGHPFVEFEGMGFLSANGQTVSLASPNALSWHSIPGPFGAPVVVSGNINVSAIVVSNTPLVLTLSDSSQLGNTSETSISIGNPSSVVYSVSFARGYTLGSSSESLSPHSTIDGLNVFTNVPDGTYNVSFPPVTVAWAAYLASLGFIFGVVGLSATNSLRRPLLKCEGPTTRHAKSPNGSNLDNGKQVR